MEGQDSNKFSSFKQVRNYYIYIYWLTWIGSIQIINVKLRMLLVFHFLVQCSLRREGERGGGRGRGREGGGGRGRREEGKYTDGTLMAH